MNQQTTTRHEWTDIAAEAVDGTITLPVEARPDFYAHVHGQPVPSQEEWSGHGAPKWRPPYGSMPMSPGLAFQTIVREFGFRPTAVSFAGAWVADDTDGTPGGHPGKHPDFCCTYSIISVRTRTQVIHFLDGGVRLVAVLLEWLDEPAELLTEDPS